MKTLTLSLRGTAAAALASCLTVAQADPPFANEFHPDGRFDRLDFDEFDDFDRFHRHEFDRFDRFDDFDHHDDHRHHFDDDDDHFERRQTSVKLPAPIDDSDFVDNGRPPVEKVILGRLLFFDKILSGNRNISCSTCHHPRAATGDDLSLGIGEGGVGIGLQRTLGSGSNAIHERIPRNSPPLFNLGAREYLIFFHDGRVERDRNQPSGFKSPAGANLPKGLDNAFAAQAMFPVTSGAEMAGQRGENPIADAAAAEKLAGDGGVWDLLADRLRAIPEYVELFEEAFPSEVRTANDITFVHAANALAAYQGVAFRADASPFDAFLRGRDTLSPAEFRGMELFFGQAKCSSCHSGQFLTDHEFHAIAVPQFGPGKGDGYGGHDDFGRERVTKSKADRYKFRTPALRNIALTGPWGHTGAFTTLEEVVRHHADAVASLRSFSPSNVVMPKRSDLSNLDFLVFNNSSSRSSLESSNKLPRQSLSSSEIHDLVAFLHSLTDQYSLDLRAEIPHRVPSGLSIDR